VQVSGPSTVFVRDGQDGRKVTRHFCPTCGSTVYWFLDARPGHIGVAVGAFFDSHFQGPIRSVWEQSRHEWLSVGSHVQHFSRNSSGPLPAAPMSSEPAARV